jgi:hypothetical protein
MIRNEFSSPPVTTRVQAAATSAGDPRFADGHRTPKWPIRFEPSQPCLGPSVGELVWKLSGAALMDLAAD